MKTIDLTEAFKGLDPESRFRRYRELWQKTGAYEVLTSYPLHLDLELAGVCNLKCTSCFQNGLLEGPLGLMDVALFKRIIDDGVPKGLCAVKLQIRGESFLHPEIFHCIEYAKEKGVLDVQITTNGNLLTGGKIRRLLDSGLDAVIFSVDGHHAGNFPEQGERTYASTEEIVKELLATRKAMGREKPWVRLQASIPEVDPRSHARARAYLTETFPDADIYVVSRIYDFRMDHDAYPDLHTHYILNPCAYPMQRLAVFWNGEVTVCCSDYNNHFRLGDLGQSSIQEIWRSPGLEGFRKRHLNGKRDTMEICRHCPASLDLKENTNLVLDKTKCHKSDYETHE